MRHIYGSSLECLLVLQAAAQAGTHPVEAWNVVNSWFDMKDKLSIASAVQARSHRAVLFFEQRGCTL